MPRLTHSTPRYRKHRASGQAIVTLDGKDFYLGPHGSKASVAEYDRLVAEWLANGRRLPDRTSQKSISVTELAVQYWKFARVYYRKNGKPTSEVGLIKIVLRQLRRLYGKTPAEDFGPLRLKAVRETWLAQKLCRTTVNKYTQLLVRVFKWGVAEELIQPDVYQALNAVAGLKKGRSEAMDYAPVPPINDQSVEATLSHLGPIVADMIRLQRLTGMRPGELVLMRPGDVKQDGNVWHYTPEGHKTEHHDKIRVIPIGPQAQSLLQPYLDREATKYCFSPSESEAERRRQQRAKRKSKVQPTQLDRRDRNAKRRPNSRYTTDSYRRAIRRACDLAGIPRWSPNRLRHSAATKIRQTFGLDAAQVFLGHANADVTQVYAEKDQQLAALVALQMG